MALDPLDALSLAAARRFASFAEGSASVLDLLALTAPGGCVLLGQIDWDAGECKVLDVRGELVAHGSSLPLAENGADLIDRGALDGLGAKAWMTAPLDASDGSVKGVLLASPGDNGTSPDQLARTLVVGARLLAYEWESVAARAELQRLAEAARDRESTDPVTGLPSRAALLGAVEREWELSKRGSVESHVVACHVRDRAALVDRHGAAVADLILKDVSGVLAGGVRRADHLARTGDDSLVAVLVGCKGANGALAFLARLEQVLVRVTSERPEAVRLSYGLQPLAGTDSGRQAVELAEVAARAGQYVAPLDRAAAGEEA